MHRSLPAIVCIYILFATSVWSLDNITFRVAPGDSLYGAMGKIENDNDTAAVVVIRKYSPWYIASCIGTAVGDPRMLLRKSEISGPEKRDECPKGGAYAVYLFDVTAPVTNTQMYLVFEGTMVTCDGTGGTPPSFKATVCHADLDVDSDNNSQAPGKFPAQNEIEDSREEYDPVLVCVNRGHHEKPGRGQPEDFEIAGIAVDDPDLVGAVVHIQPQAGMATFDYDQSKIKLYRMSDRSLLESRTSYRFSIDETELLIEGITIGTGPILMEFVPDNSQDGIPVVDVVAYQVIDFAITRTTPFYLADAKAWYVYRFKVLGLPTDAKLKVDGGIVTGKFESILLPQEFQRPILAPRAPRPIRTPSPDRLGNGNGQDYLAVIDEAAFNRLHTEADIETMYLELSKIEGKVIVGGVEKVFIGGGTARSESFEFADERVECIEIGTDESVSKLTSVTRQNQFDSSPRNTFAKWDKYNDFLGDGPIFPSRFEPPTGFNIDESPNPAHVTQQCSMYDAFLPIDAGNEGAWTAEARSLGLQRGQYFVAHWPSIKNSGFGVPVVGKLPSSGHRRVQWQTRLRGSWGVHINTKSSGQIINDGLSYGIAVARALENLPLPPIWGGGIKTVAEIAERVSEVLSLLPASDPAGMGAGIEILGDFVDVGRAATPLPLPELIFEAVVPNGPNNENLNGSGNLAFQPIVKYDGNELDVKESYRCYITSNIFARGVVRQYGVTDSSAVLQGEITEPKIVVEFTPAQERRAQNSGVQGE